MTAYSQIPEHLRSLSPYKPGKPISELEREYGITGAIKLASNENPIGPSPKAVEAVKACLGELHRYPDGAAAALTQALSRKLAVPAAKIVLGAGSDDIIHLLTRVLLRPGDEAVVPAPSFLMYDLMVRASAGVSRTVPLKGLTMDLEAMARAVGPKTRLLFLCNPNNPTGTVVSQTDFNAFLEALPDGVTVVVDEAYMEFARDPECALGLRSMDTRNRLVTLRTFSKAYGLAGLRVGYGVMPEPLADLLHRIRQPFNVSVPGQAGALAALEDTEFLARSIGTVHDGLDFFYAAFAERGLSFVKSQANFLLVDVGRDADAVFESLLAKGVIVRSMTAYGYERHIRVSVGLMAENLRFLKALDEVLG